MKRVIIMLLSIGFLLTSCDRNDTGGIDGGRMIL
jgi:predicted small secreted protein